jgi:glycosyltransferase involved in cell wall biosynthesis
MQFSIAITVYKNELFLPHAVQTVLAQTLADWEIRMYSDGRSRASEEVARQLEGAVPLHYKPITRCRGAYGNRLRRIALEESRGTHVCFLGHDCLLYPTYLETHARNIAGRKDALSVVPVAYWKKYLLRRGQPASDDLATLGEGQIDLLCIAYPRDLALEVGCFGLDMERIRCADYLGYDRLRRRSPPIFNPVPQQAAHF